MERRGKHNSFVLYTDYSQHIALLSNEEAGRLFKALFEFVETGELPELSGSLEMCFSFISSQIQRDKQKYEEVCEKRAEAGRLGGKQKQANLANASFAKKNQASVAENDTKAENDNEFDIDYICLLLNKAKEKVNSKGRLRVNYGAFVIKELMDVGIKYNVIKKTAEELAEKGEDVDWFSFSKIVKNRKTKGDT